MGRGNWSQIWVLVIISVALLKNFSQNALAQECELNCRTQCSPQGLCICDLPSPASVLTGDRPFLGGVFCDVPAVMCNGTNSFWCENGGVCNALVQGENYTCTCTPGFTGEQCNLAGEICGDVFCYNGGLCNLPGVTSNGSCKCPPEFLGSPDCSLPTRAAELPSPPLNVPIQGKHDGNEWWVTIGIVVAILLAASCVVGTALRCHRYRARKLSQLQFHELRQLQMVDDPDFYDDGDDDSFEDGKNSIGRAFK